MKFDHGNEVELTFKSQLDRSRRFEGCAISNILSFVERLILQVPHLKISMQNISGVDILQSAQNLVNKILNMVDCEWLLAVYNAM